MLASAKKFAARSASPTAWCASPLVSRTWTISWPTSSRRWRRSSRSWRDGRPSRPAGRGRPALHRSPSPYRLPNPLQVGRTSIFDANLDALRKLVGMELTQHVTQAIKNLGCRLDHEQPLRCRLDLPLPAIDRFNLGNDVDAGGELALNQRMGDAASLIE